MNRTNQQEMQPRRLRVLRIAHASLTPRLRERERALVREYPEVDLEVLTVVRWREAEVDVDATTDSLFPVIKARPHLSKHIQLFAYDPRSVIKALRRHRPHLIDLNAEPYSVSCAEVLTLRNWFAPQTPVVLQTAQNIFHRFPPPFCWFERRALKQIAAAYVCSETVREVLRDKGFDKMIRIVPFGVNVDAYTPRPVSNRNDRLTIGFAGRLVSGKGLDVLAEALGRLSNERWQLLVVGDGPERQPFEQKLADLNVRHRAEFTGAVGYDHMPGFLRRMDVLVLVSQTLKRVREQFGRVIVEAMASGVPVIGSTSGAIPEVIGDTGLVVPEGDIDALATALRQVLSDNALRRRLALAGRKRAEANYSWQCVAAKTYELYRQVLRENVAPDLSQEFEVAA